MKINLHLSMQNKRNAHVQPRSKKTQMKGLKGIQRQNPNPRSGKRKN